MGKERFERSKGECLHVCVYIRVVYQRGQKSNKSKKQKKRQQKKINHNCKPNHSTTVATTSVVSNISNNHKSYHHLSMNSNIEDDPWASGWNDSTNNSNDTNSTSTPFQSTYLTSSQLFTSSSINRNSDGISTPLPHHHTQPLINSMNNIPSSYELIYSHFMNKINTINDFEINIIDKLVSMNYLTNYQKQKILDTIYDNELLPITQSSKFYQILGLLALEIDVPGTGDFVTLQFRLNNLPNLPEKFINEVTQDIEDDPLMGNRNRTNRGEGGKEEEEDYDDELGNTSGLIHDPLLVDHSHIHDESNDDHEEESHGQNQQVFASDVDSEYIEKYINDLKDEFKPLFLGVDLIKIKEVPEKEGILFKHINYIITHDLKFSGSSSQGTKKVIRRYSDFVWLMEYLLEKYPFRVIPGLPPKKFTGMLFFFY